MPSESSSIFLFCESTIPAHRDELRALAASLNLPLIQSLKNLPPATSKTFLLVRTADRLELREPAVPRTHPLFVDLTTHFHSPPSSRSLNQPLARALNKQNRPLSSSHNSAPQNPQQPSTTIASLSQPYILDCTAGFAADSALLLSLGFSILAVERNPILHALINDALRRALLDPLAAPHIASRFRLLHADAQTILPQLSSPPAVAYIDPMFPPKRKVSALPPRPAQILRELVGPDPDASSLIALARSIIPRVVIKRPHEAPPLSPPPTATITTKLLRYEICCRA